jgi:acetyl-CoA carboxylase carboxyl transferase subunit beta
MFTKCHKCEKILYIKDFERDLKVCPKCGYHHKLSAGERIAFTADPHSFVERDRDLAAADPLGFPDYAAKAERGCQSTGRSDALVTGTAKIGGYPCVLGVVDFHFIGGSMGAAFGEKFVRAAEHAIGQKLPMILFCASGGARMQEGLFGLMQMAKTSAAVAQLSEARVPYIVVMTDPTTGGALASFASLGDVILAEPGAYIAFAGTRVAQQAQTHKPPANYQTAEFQEEHGMVDRVAPRKEIRDTLIRLLAFFGGETAPPGSEPAGDTLDHAPVVTQRIPAGRNGRGNP